MKRTNTKLQLKATTIRVLHDSELSKAAGGATFQCSEQGGCTSHPPEHHHTSSHHGNNGNNGN